MTYKVEANIPIPSGGKRRAGFTQTLREMKPGDSFIAGDINCRNSVASSARTAGIKIVTRLVEDKKIRVWKVA